MKASNYLDEIREFCYANGIIQPTRVNIDSDNDVVVEWSSRERRFGLVFDNDVKAIAYYLADTTEEVIDDGLISLDDVFHALKNFWLAV